MADLRFKPPAVQLYSVREQLANGSRAEVLRRVADIGFGAVEPYRPTDDPTGFRKIVDDLGLAVCAVHAGSLAHGVDIRAVFEAAGIVGTTHIVVPSAPAREDFLTSDGVKRMADLLNELARRAAAYGLQLGYHNHEYELASMIDGRPALDVLVDHLVPQVFLEIDTYWAAVGGVDVTELLTRYGKRVRMLHLKDGSARRDDPNVALGNGTLPISDYLAAAPKAWRVVEFDHCATDVFEALDASLAHLKALS